MKKIIIISLLILMNQSNAINQGSILPAPQQLFDIFPHKNIYNGIYIATQIEDLLKAATPTTVDQTISDILKAYNSFSPHFKKLIAKRFKKFNLNIISKTIWNINEQNQCGVLFDHTYISGPYCTEHAAKSWPKIYTEYISTYKATEYNPWFQLTLQEILLKYAERMKTSPFHLKKQIRNSIN